MLERARAKAPGLTWEQADALALPYPDDAFDAATVGFGARNFSDLAARAARDGARGQAGRARGDPRDHDAAEAAPVHVLLFVVRSPRAAARPLRRGLHVPAELGQALPGAGSRWPPSWSPPGCRTSAGSSPRAGSSRCTTGRSSLMASAEAVAAVVEAGGAHVPGLMRDLEERLATIAQSHGATLGEHAGATIAAGGKRLRPLLVFVAAGPDPAGRDAALRAAVAVELVHSRDAGPRRRARRRGAAPRPADGRRVRRALDRDGDGRPAVLARVRRAGGRRNGRAGARAVGRVVGARPGRAAAARGRLEAADDARALPAALRSQDRAAVPRRVRAGRAGRRRQRRAAGRVRRAHRARVPAARRRAGRVRARRSGPASTAGPTCSTARSRCR